MRKKSISLLSIILLCIFIAGCAGHCIRVGGSYKDYSGDLEYCFNSQKSKDTGVPVIEETKETGETKDFFGFDMDQIKSIYDRVKGVTASSESRAVRDDEDVIRELLEILQHEPAE